MNSASKQAAEIISILGSEHCSLVNALIKAQVLAYQIGQASLGEWVGWELSGYPDGAEVPVYRMLRLQPRAVISDGFNRYPDFQLPTFHLDDDVRNRVLNSRVAKGVTAIEAWKGVEAVANYPVEYAAFFEGALAEDISIERIWGKPETGAYEQILVQIRHRLLRYVMEIQETLPQGDDTTESESESDLMKDQRESVFKHVVFGDNTTIQLGNSNVATVTNTVTQGDVSSLIEHLRKSGVSDEDLMTLKAAVASDGDEPKTSGKLGAAVGGWVHGLLGKALGGAWDISVSAAGSLLGNALSTYYGVSVG
ncbi:TPA: hypothetical protein ACKP5X_000590 [Stenotrophomonas maltophilia]